MIGVDTEVDWDCVCAQPTCADSDDGAVPDDGGCEEIDDSSVGRCQPIAPIIAKNVRLLNI